MLLDCSTYSDGTQYCYELCIIIQHFNPPAVVVEVYVSIKSYTVFLFVAQMHVKRHFVVLQELCNFHYIQDKFLVLSRIN